MNWRRALTWAAVSMPFVAMLALGFGRDPRATPSLLVGRPAPVFTLMDMHGKSWALEQLRGRPVVLNFWASWCYPCLAEHATLQTAAEALGDKASFVGVIYEDSKDGIAQFLRGKQDNIPQLLDPGSRVALDYGVAGVPESFIIDAAGIVRHKQAGVLSEATMRQHLLPLVGREGKMP